MRHIPNIQFDVMKRLFSWLVLGCLFLAANGAQADSLYRNFGTISNPAPIDAVTVENYGSISALGSVPFDTQNTLNFYNDSGATIFAIPGLTLQHVPATGLASSPAYGITNLGSILVESTLNILPNGVTFLPSSQMLLNATNIISPGLIGGDRASVVKIIGENVDLSLGLIRGSDGSASTFVNLDEGDLFTLNNNPFYDSPYNAVDRYWGAGNGQNVGLASIAFGLESGISPSHTVTLGPNSLGSTAGSGRSTLNTSLFVPGYSFYMLPPDTRSCPNGFHPDKPYYQPDHSRLFPWLLEREQSSAFRSGD
jgi:hypothetical protein